MMIVFVDANVLVDVLLCRPNLEVESREVWAAAENRIVQAFVSSLSISTIYYLVQKQSHDRGYALQCVNSILQVFQVAAVDSAIVHLAAASGQRDFEDALQAFCARSVSAACVVTRNTRDFVGGPVRPVTPGEFIEMLRASNQS